MTTITTPIRFPIIKREKFDEDNIKSLLSDERFSKQDRIRLSQYNKHRVSGSEVNVSYKFGNGCDEHQLGRLFPEDGIGLQSFRFDIRNPLASKFYWDTDIDNCHYRIALKFCNDYNLKCEKINEYVSNRQECLNLVSDNRKKAKTEFLKALYLGDVTMYSSTYQEIDGDITEDGYKFLQEIKLEVETLAEKIWTKHPQFHKLKTGQDKKMISKKRNPMASLMSIIFQTEERKMLMEWDTFLKTHNREISVYIHDGGYVEKLEGETMFPNELLEEGIIHIKNVLGYDVILTNKNINYDWKPFKPQESQYDIMKREFELKNFMIGPLLCCIHSDGQMEFLRYGDAKIKYANKHIQIWNDESQKMVKEKFLELWIEDPKRLQYDRVGFFPNESLCPPSIYNLFKGFNAKKYEMEMSDDDVNKNVQKIITHLDYLTSGHGLWTCKYFANIIQTPDKKGEVAILIRDQGGLVIEGGGTGKNLLFEWFGNEIIGSEYIHIVGDNKELYGNFNSPFEGKLLVFVEEACGKDNHTNTDLLKSKITNKKMSVNKKCVAQYTIDDYARYMFTSNGRNPLPIRQGDRRFGVFDTNPVMRGNIDYFEDLSNHLNKPETKWAFYKFLMKMDTYNNPIQFQKNIPITNAYMDIRLINAPQYHKWLVYKLQSRTLSDGYTNDLYKDFREWISEFKEKDKDNVISQTMFGSLLSNAKDVQRNDYIIDDYGNKRKKHGVMYMEWNIQSLVDGFKSIYLLDKSFEYDMESPLESEEMKE